MARRTAVATPDPDDEGTGDAGREPGVGPAKPKGGRPARGASGNADRAHIAQRRARVETMELAGFSGRKIAEHLQVDESTIRADLVAIRAARREDAAGVDLDTERSLELARLEEQRSYLAATAAKGSLGANRELLRIAQRKAALLGLDAPRRVSVSGDVAVTLAEGLTDAELLGLLDDDDQDG